MISENTRFSFHCYSDPKIPFLTGSSISGSVERVAIMEPGHFRLAELSTNPASTDLVATTNVAMYMKADKFIIAYKISTTIHYVYLPLDGSSNTWTHTTTAP